MAEMQGNNEQDNTLSADIEGLESFLDEFEEDSSAAVGSQDTAVADDGPLDLDLGEIPELNEVALENGGAEHIDEALTEQSSDEQAGSDLADLNLAIDNSSPLKDTLPSSATAFSSTHPASPISAPGHDNFSIVTFAVAAIAVVASGLMVWWASDLSDQLTTVRSQLIVVNQKAGQADVGGTQDLAMLTQLDERITELSIVIEGPVSHLLENNKREMSDLHARLDEIERALAMTPAPPVVADSQTKNPGGVWVVNLVSFPRPAVADSELAKLSRVGIQAEKYQVNSKKITWYRVRVTGFDSRQAAKSYADTEALEAGYTQAWISRF